MSRCRPSLHGLIDQCVYDSIITITVCIDRSDTIFQPIYSIDAGIRSSLEDINRNSYLIGEILLMPKHETWIRRDVSIERAAATTRIEGATMTDEEVGELIKKPAITAKLSEDELANLNAVEAYEFVDYLSGEPSIDVDELVVRQLNRYFLKRMDPVLTPGVYRKGQNEVFKFTPPDQSEVPALMRDLGLWLADGEKEIDPVIEAALAHIQFVAIHPFWDGNGRTARALATLILQRAFPGFKNLLSLEAYIFSIRDHYFTAIESTLGAIYKSDYDATPWVKFFVGSLLIHTRRLAHRITDWRRMSDDVHAMFPDDYPPRRVDAILYAAQVGRITRADYIEITGVSPATASRDLKELVKEGVLSPVGEKRARVYLYIEPPAEEPAEQRRLFNGGDPIA